MSNFDETLMKRLTKLEREVERLRVKERPAGGSGVTDHGALTGLDSTDFGRPVSLASPLTGTTWNMSSPKSSTSPTLIDMSATFVNYPATPPKALMVRLIARDSVAVHRTDLYAAFGPSVTSYYQLSVHPVGGDIQAATGGIINCNANGDIAYSLVASGTGTMDVQLEIWGYWL